MKLRLIRWRFGGLARHGSLLLCWMLLRAIMQAAMIMLLARQLGAESYGLFVALVATASFFTPFVGLGLSHMLLRNAARDPANEAAYLGRALRSWARTLPLCGIAALVFALWVLPKHGTFITLCAIIAAELAAVSLTELCARHWQARQQTNAYGAINAGLPGVRLLALGLLFLFVRNVEINATLWVYAISSLLYAGLLWILVRSERVEPDALTPEPMTASNGLPFSFAAFAMKLQAEFNKPALAQVGLGLAGTYNIAQRAVDLACLPLVALQEALWPRLYGVSNPIRQLSSIGAALLGLALAVGIVVWLAAPLIPYVLGKSFAGVVPALRLLAWLPILQVLRALLNFLAIHRSQMQQIGWVHAAGAGLSVVAVSAFVPTYGISGAILAAYVAEIAVVTFLIAIAARAAR